jgi:hypothetical protein
MQCKLTEMYYVVSNTSALVSLGTGTDHSLRSGSQFILIGTAPYIEPALVSFSAA